MNVSMGDSFNLGWKLAAVLRNQSAPELLTSYSDERQSVAQDLIDFDRNGRALSVSAMQTMATHQNSRNISFSMDATLQAYQSGMARPS